MPSAPGCVHQSSSGYLTFRHWPACPPQWHSFRHDRAGKRATGCTRHHSDAIHPSPCSLQEPANPSGVSSVPLVQRLPFNPSAPTAKWSTETRSNCVLAPISKASCARHRCRSTVFIRNEPEIRGCPAHRFVPSSVPKNSCSARSNYGTMPRCAPKFPEDKSLHT